MPSSGGCCKNNRGEGPLLCAEYSRFWVCAFFALSAPMMIAENVANVICCEVLAVICENFKKELT